eukprot:2503691-Amphidinium_carterae.1
MGVDPPMHKLLFGRRKTHSPLTACRNYVHYLNHASHCSRRSNRCASGKHQTHMSADKPSNQFLKKTVPKRTSSVTSSALAQAGCKSSLAYVCRSTLCTMDVAVTFLPNLR